MKRKQVYLTEQLNRKLSELAISRGVSQAEVIREGLEMYLVSMEEKEKDWEKLIEQMKNSPFQKIAWSRDDLYADRLRGFSDGGK